MIGKTKASTTGFGIDFGPSIEADIGPDEELSGSSRLGASTSLPPLFSRSWADTNDVENVRNFFIKEHGSIVTTEAVCLTNQFDIGFYSQKVFVDPFLDAVEALHWATEKDDETSKLIEFKRFVNEFGTHYSTTSQMGTKLSIERRYTAQERASSSQNDLKNCNTLAGAKVFGLQTEESHFNCKNKNLLDSNLESKNVERTIVTTHGSFIANSLAEWSKQVINLVMADTFSPRVIRRELKPILHLFDENNFVNITFSSGDHVAKVNVTRIKQWIEPMMSNYCAIFDLDCNRSGCGIDDNCSTEHWCIDDSPEGIQCIPRSTYYII